MRTSGPAVRGAVVDKAGDAPFGPHAASILSTEHWGLLAARSLLWTEASSRTTVLLTVLSASIIALALQTNASGFGPQTTQLALVLLPLVLLLGIATYVRLMRINNEEYLLTIAMNRLRLAYLKIEPGLEPYFTTGHHDDEQGVMATYLVDRPSRLEWWIYFLVNTPTVVATVVATLAAVIVVLVLQVAALPAVPAGAGAVVAFLAVWGGLFLLQKHSTDAVRATTPRFPTPPQ